MRKYARLRERVSAVAPQSHARPAGRDRRRARDGARSRLHRRGDYAARSTRGRCGASAFRGRRRWSSARDDPPARRLRPAAARSPAARASTSPAARIMRTAISAKGSACSTTPRSPRATLQSEGLVRRVLIVDLDVHQGDGTAAILAGDDDVHTLSLHGRNNFPFRKAASRLTSSSTIAPATRRTSRRCASRLPLAIERSAARARDLSRRRGPLRARPARPARAHQARPRDARRVRARHAARTRGIPVAIAMAGGYAENIDDVVDIHFATVSAALERFGDVARARLVGRSRRSCAPRCLPRERHGPARPRRCGRDADAQSPRRAQCARPRDGRCADRANRASSPPTTACASSCSEAPASTSWPAATSACSPSRLHEDDGDAARVVPALVERVHASSRRSHACRSR